MRQILPKNRPPSSIGPPSTTIGSFEIIGPLANVVLMTHTCTPELEALELTTLLLRHHHIHSGLWTLQVRFETSGFNVVGRDAGGASPGVLVTVQSVSLRSVDRPDALTVDAAAVNPR